MHRVRLLVLVFLIPVALLGQVDVRFSVHNLPAEAEGKIGIRGSVAPLDWDVSLPLQRQGDSAWVVVQFSADSRVEYKYVVERETGDVRWETIDNRSIEGQAKGAKADRWNTAPLIDFSALPKLSPDALQADYALVESMVLDVHPGTYRYNDEAAIQAALDTLWASFQAPLTLEETYLALSRLTAALQCDHTKPGFNNQSNLMTALLHGQSDKLPFTFRWLGEDMIVEYNASDAAELAPGAQVLTINGISVSQILHQLLPYVGADGGTNANRINKLAVEGFDFRYNAFDVFYPLHFPLKTGDLAMHVIPFGSAGVMRVTVPALTREARAAILEERYPVFPGNRDDMWDFTITPEGVGVLTMNSFGLMGWKGMTLDYKAFLAEAFARMAQDDVEHLVLDIRRNTGGVDEMKHELFRYLDCHTPTETWREWRTRFALFPDALKPHVQTWVDEPYYYTLEPDFVDTETGQYVFTEELLAPVEKANDVFAGDLFLLTSPANTSLAFYTARAFRTQCKGTMVGQTTGGNQNGINGGQILFLRLPNAGIEIVFPIKGGFALEAQPNNGIMPNVFVAPTQASITAGDDPVMEAVLHLLNLD